MRPLTAQVQTETPTDPRKLLLTPEKWTTSAKTLCDDEVRGAVGNARFGDCHEERVQSISLKSCQNCQSSDLRTFREIDAHVDKQRLGETVSSKVVFGGRARTVKAKVIANTGIESQGKNFDLISELAQN